MRTGFFLAGEKTGAFHHHINTEFSPGQLGRIALSEHFDAAISHHKGVAINADILSKTPMRGVILQQVGVCRRITQIIDRDDFELILLARLEHGPEHIAADPAKTINCYFDRHGLISLFD